MNVTVQRGIALIMALSVILLLSIALMKTFENRTVETVHLANSLQRFQAETLSRSVFRAILMTLKTKGLVFVHKNSKQWQGIPIPLNEGQYFQINQIQSIDHLFNLNRRFRRSDPWPAVFLNIVNRYQTGKDPLAIEHALDDVTPILSALNDWIDPDDEADGEFLYDNEEYSDVTPEFEVKNRNLDRLSEIKLIPAIQELGFNQKELQERFRIFAIDKNSNLMTIDLNLSTPSAVEQFLLNFKDVEKYPNVYDASATIREILEERDNELEEVTGETGYSDPDPRFSPPLYTRGGSLWEKRLESEGIELSAAEKELFSSYTKLLTIDFSVTTVRVTVKTEAILEVEYQAASGQNLDIKSFKILQLTMK